MVHWDVVNLTDEVHPTPEDDAAQQHQRHTNSVIAHTLPDEVARAIGKRHPDHQRTKFDATRNFIPVGGEEGDDAQPNKNGAQDR